MDGMIVRHFLWFGILALIYVRLRLKRQAQQMAESDRLGKINDVRRELNLPPISK
jgi:hypothetical protein